MMHVLACLFETKRVLSEFLTRYSAKSFGFEVFKTRVVCCTKKRAEETRDMKRHETRDMTHEM